MLLSMLAGSTPLLDGPGLVAFTAAALLGVATLWMAGRALARGRRIHQSESGGPAFGWRTEPAPILVRARRPDVPGRPRPRAPGAGDGTASTCPWAR